MILSHPTFIGSTLESFRVRAEFPVSTIEAADEAPLCVDLDGTLVRTDTLVEMLFALPRDWRTALGLVRAMFGGRAAIKSFVAANARLDPALLPYNEELVQYLIAEKARGRRLVLATASHAIVAHKVAGELGLFDDVIASQGADNLKGKRKAQALVERFGERGFCYAGNERGDVPVWRRAKAAIVVNAPARVASQAARDAPVEARFDRDRSRFAALVRALRPHQWTKNLLVFVPAMTGAHGLWEPNVWVGALLAFFSFSAVASSIYLVNDLFDLAADRAHPRKRHRPFASGALQPSLGLAAAGVLLLVGAALGAGCGLLPILGLYAATSIGYSVWLKELPLVDIFALATLYTLRLFAGGVATGYFVSLWLLGFSGFFFLESRRPETG